MQDAPAASVADQPDEAAVAKAKLLIAGWGLVNNTSSASLLQTASVPYVPNAECGAKFTQYFRDKARGSTVPEITIPDSVMCAGGSPANTCKGDSGGPLILPDSSGNWRGDIVVGVVSFGVLGCGESFPPGAFTRLSFYEADIARFVPSTSAPIARSPPPTPPPRPILLPSPPPPANLQREQLAGPACAQRGGTCASSFCAVAGPYLGTSFASGEACAATAASTPGCGEVVAYSRFFNFFRGCYCCAPGSGTTPSSFYELYGVVNRQQQPPPPTTMTSSNSFQRFEHTACPYGKYMGRNFGSAEECIAKARSDPECPSRLLFAPNLFSGSCYCCNAAAPRDSRQSSSVFDLYEF